MRISNGNHFYGVLSLRDDWANVESVAHSSHHEL